MSTTEATPPPTRLERLRRAVGAAPTGEDLAELAETEAEASALVATETGQHEVPQVIQDRAVLMCAGSLWLTRKHPDGIVHFGGLDSAPVRAARDPMHRARTILAPYLGGGFA